MTLTWRGPEVAREIHRRAGIAARKGAEDLFNAAQQTVPTDPGDELSRSGKVSSSENVSAVSYATDYAVLQHERMDYEHDPGRSSKWLERAMSGRRTEIARIIRRELKL
jgi:hypothetical protein